jgi:hypothetical protein
MLNFNISPYGPDNDRVYHRIGNGNTTKQARELVEDMKEMERQIKAIPDPHKICPYCDHPALDHVVGCWETNT